MAKAIVQHPLFVEKRTKKEIAAGVPAVNVMVSDISDTGVELSVGVWSPSHDQSWQQLSDIRQTIMTEFAKLPDSVPLSSMAVRAADSGSKKA
jgi:small-conductance mechanosensitive channel